MSPPPKGVAPLSPYKPTHNPQSLHQPFKSLRWPIYNIIYNQITLLAPPTQHHSFFRNFHPELLLSSKSYTIARCHLLRLRISCCVAPPFKDTQVVLCPAESFQHNRNVVTTPFGSVGGSQVTSKELVFGITFIMTGSPGTKKIKQLLKQINKGFR